MNLYSLKAVKKDKAKQIVPTAIFTPADSIVNVTLELIEPPLSGGNGSVNWDATKQYGIRVLLQSPVGDPTGSYSFQLDFGENVPFSIYDLVYDDDDNSGLDLSDWDGVGATTVTVSRWL